MSIRRVFAPSARNAQRGAVLFISLIMLVVLALIGIAGMQVTTLQERMAGNYYTIGRSFENSEWGLRTTENNIQAAVDAGGAYTQPPPAAGQPPQPVVDTLCSNLDMDGWSASKTAQTAFVTYVARIDHCIPGNPKKWGPPASTDTTSIYQITSVEPDTTSLNMAAGAGVSVVAVQTVYIP